MAAENVIPRLILISIAVLGYLLVGIAHWRHGMKWVFSAYTALVVSALVLLAGIVADITYAITIVRFGVAVSAILFFIATHQSKQTINDLRDEIAERTITLGGDTG